MNRVIHEWAGSQQHMKVVFFGTPEFAVPSIQRLIEQPEIDVVAVVTQPDKRRGRGNELMPSPVKAIALERQIPIWQPKSVKKNVETLEALAATGADAFVVVAYGQILSPAILAMPRLGCVNAHGSLLPKYRGAAPIQWCLYHGDRETGITTMLMDAGMDTGAMLLEAKTEIGLLDNFHTLAHRLAQLSADILVETLLKLDQGSLQSIPQDDSHATYAPLIQKADYDLDWSRSAIALHNQIRGFYPHCTTTLRDAAIKVLATIPLDSELLSQLPNPNADLILRSQEWLPLSQATTDSPSPGQIVAIAKGWGIVVQTGEGLLLLTEVQPAGKRPQSGLDFANGARLAIGEAFKVH